jgi:hypothetical protein
LLYSKISASCVKAAAGIAFSEITVLIYFSFRRGEGR